VSGEVIPFDDAVLVRQCLRGDPTAFEPLVVKYQDRIFNLCWRMCGDRQAAEDLTQETFLRAFEGLRQFKGHSSFFTWLYRIAVNLAVSYRRRERAHMKIAGDERWQDLPGQAKGLRDNAAQQRPDCLAEQHEVRQIVWQALQSLEEDHRTVLILRDMEGLDYAQIAKVLKVPVGTVKSRLFRARMAMRERLMPLLRPAQPETG